MSTELERARTWYAELSAALAPTDAPPTPAGMREAYDLACEAMPIAPDAVVESVNAGGVPGAWISVGASTAERALLYLHPGGYAVGSVKGHRHVIAAYAGAAQARVLAIDYRLAPEHPHPAAVLDAVAAFDFIVAQGVAPGSVAIVGESAGGGLALATLVALRDRGGATPACAVAVSPWTDMTLASPSMQSRRDVDPVNSPEMLGGLAQMYLMGADPSTPLASPLFADLTGLPPLLILAGDAEVLRDDAARFAERARAAGVDTTLEIADEMIHIWTFFESFLPEGRAAIGRAGEFIVQHTG